MRTSSKSRLESIERLLLAIDVLGPAAVNESGNTAALRHLFKRDKDGFRKIRVALEEAGASRADIMEMVEPTNNELDQKTQDREDDATIAALADLSPIAFAKRRAAAATELGIMVCHAPTESNCFGVAETTIAFMLSLLKKVAERDADVRAGKWRTADNFAYYVGSRASDGFPGQTVGLVGLGRIGTRVAQLLAPWRARIIAYDPYVPPAHFLTHGVTSVDYQTLLRESDVVSFHVVLTPETRYMFGEAELKLMKPNAIVLNTARGKVVDEKALARAIDEGRIRGAAIDAFEEEPLPADSPLRKLGDRVLLSPHSASYTEGGELRQGVAWATRSVVTALKGGIPDNVYNRERWKERFGGASAAGA